MIRLKTEPKSLSVCGNPAEVMLFYCIWQTQLWPGWLQYELDPKHDPIKQHLDVVKTVSDGGELMLDHSHAECIKAAGYAMRLCSRFGVDIELTGSSRTPDETLAEVYDRIQHDTTVD